jgi:hypothetical protein
MTSLDPKSAIARDTATPRTSFNLLESSGLGGGLCHKDAMVLLSFATLASQNEV